MAAAPRAWPSALGHRRLRVSRLTRDGDSQSWDILIGVAGRPVDSPMLLVMSDATGTPAEYRVELIRRGMTMLLPRIKRPGLSDDDTMPRL